MGQPLIFCLKSMTFSNSRHMSLNLLLFIVKAYYLIKELDALSSKFILFIPQILFLIRLNTSFLLAFLVLTKIMTHAR